MTEMYNQAQNYEISLKISLFHLFILMGKIGEANVTSALSSAQHICLSSLDPCTPNILYVTGTANRNELVDPKPLI